MKDDVAVEIFWGGPKSYLKESLAEAKKGSPLEKEQEQAGVLPDWPMPPGGLTVPVEILFGKMLTVIAVVILCYIEQGTRAFGAPVGGLIIF